MKQILLNRVLTKTRIQPLFIIFDGMNYFSLMVCFLISFASSAQMSYIEKRYKYFEPIPKTDKIIDIPMYENLQIRKKLPYVFWHFCKQKERQLGLKNPEITKDSLIFRIWVSGQSSKKNQEHTICEINFDSSGWHGILVFMKVDFSTKKLMETIKESKRFTIEPTNLTWTQLIDSLKFYKFDSLITDEKIPGYYKSDEGYSNNDETYCFEFSTKSIYRYYQYNQYYRKEQKYWQAKNVSAIINLLDREFNWSAKAKEYWQ